MAEFENPTWRPTQVQSLLIHAALDDGERARDAFAAWVAAVDMANLDSGSERVLPLLYRNLQRLGVSHPAMRILGRHYRHTWAKNQLAMHSLEELLAAFAARGVATLVLKGAALLLRYYGDSGTRPMADFDVLVPTQQTEAAFAVLVELGWESKKGLHLLPAEHRAPFHGMGYFHPEKLLGCDLHWHVMHMNLAARYDAPLWAAALPLQVGQVASRTLCAEHQLIHILFNGCINEDGQNMRWLPDALMLLRHEPAIDWDRFVAQCQLLEFVEPVVEILKYLRAEWAVPVPDATLDALTQTPVRYAIHKSYESLNRRKDERSGWQVFWILYVQYQLAQEGAQGFFLRDFIRFLRHRWSLDRGLRQTLNYAWQRTRGVTAKQAREMV